MVIKFTFKDWNDNIILALCELPSIEPIGPVLIIDFAVKPDDYFKGCGFDKDYSK